jgi:hypothetical protein
MPPREEQVAQIEAALRSRFFPLVPSLGVARWTPGQDETNRLSRALAAYALVGICDLDDARAAACITDGGDDGGIDAAHYDQASGQLVLVQAKFKRSGTAPTQAECLATVNGVKALREKRFDQFNAHFQNRLDEIEEALDTPGVGIKIVLVYLGDSLGPHATIDLNNYRDEANGVTEIVQWSDCGRATVHGWLVEEHAPGNVTVNATLELWKCVTAPRKAIYGQISAGSLASLAQQHGKALFQRNIRHYLGTFGVNAAIMETVRTAPGDLFYLNNGITIVAEEVRQSAGTEASCTFEFVNASIVNGAQTAGAMLTASQNGTISPEARLLVTVIEIGQGADELGVRITRARNHQNIVRGIDFAALDPTQERLRRELAAAGYRYFYRPSEEARLGGPRSFTVEDAALAIVCLGFMPLSRADVTQRRARGQSVHNAVDLVVAAKKEVSRLWDQSGPLYPQLFIDTMTGIRICRLVQIFRFLNEILAGSERSENAYFRRMFFRHGRYFIMAFVALRCPQIITRAAHDLSAEDRTELSRQTNELSELIYAASADRQWEKGYLAIFRNLTDAQPLADKVLQRLAAPAPVTPPPAPTPAAARTVTAPVDGGAVAAPPAPEPNPAPDAEQADDEQGNAS